MFFSFSFFLIFQFFYFSTQKQVCVPDPPEWCLGPFCNQPWGECRAYNNDQLSPPDNPGPKTCIPNEAILNNGCARLTLVLSRDRLPPETRVRSVCQGLRAAWADRHAHSSSIHPVILCALAAGTNATVEVTLVSIFTSLPKMIK